MIEEIGAATAAIKSLGLAIDELGVVALAALAVVAVVVLYRDNRALSHRYAETVEALTAELRETRQDLDRAIVALDRRIT